MKITEKHKIKYLRRYEHIISLDANFLSKIEKMPIPLKIGKVKIKHSGEIQLQHIMLSWNIKGENELLTTTAKAYELNEQEVDNYPLIDFLRLTVELSQVAKHSSDMFKNLKRESKDEDVKNITSKLNAGDRDVFVEIMKLSNGAYTQTQVAELPWMLAYDILKVATLEYDKQLALADIQQKKMKHGTKRT